MYYYSISVALMSTLWVSDTRIRKWILSRPCWIFQNKYNTVNEQIKAISCADDLLSGMLYCLIVYACMHVSIHRLYVYYNRIHSV